MNQKLSVVVMCHNNAEELERNLPMLLSQEYEGGYEVIVVVEKGEDDTDDALTRLKSQYPPQGSLQEPLYTTYVPESSRYVSRKKLGVTLGVKAAKTEWIVLTEATCRPLSHQWLSAIASAATDEKDMVLGYANFDEDTSSFKRFLTLKRQLGLCRAAQKKTAYSQESRILMFRKTMFLSGKGYDGNLKYIGGEYEFIVNKFAKRGNTAVALSPESWLQEENPTSKQWKNRQLFHLETRRHLKRSWGHRLPILADQLFLHVGYLAEVVAIVWGALTANWLVVAIAAVALIATCIVRTLLKARVCQAFNTKVPVWKLPFFDLGWAWHYLYNIIRYKAADKDSFICHKI